MKFSRKSVFFSAVAATATLVSLPALAHTRLIDFEGVSGGSKIETFYGQGTDASGVAGPNLGVTFSGGAVAFRSDAPDAIFANAPTPGTAMIATDAAATLNFATGFEGTLGFYYSARSDADDVVTIFGGLDRTGPVLGEISLSGNGQLDGCTAAALCYWQRLQLSFSGIGRSIGFGGNAGNVAYDNITITPVPEPGTCAMMALGLAGVMVAARRQRKA